jgi:16S rRNA (guanine966-N2)-methyltransferase
MRAPTAKPGRPQRLLRIIGGQWRGRKIHFPALDIRPTPDRVRETLFNWLQPRIQGARCLDLFAGSGALGLEALSRGAAEVVFVEQARAASVAIQRVLQQWPAAGRASVLCMEAQRYLTGNAPSPFDLVLLDPPYASGEIAAAARALERGWLASDARIYIEHARRESLPALPASWHELRAGTAGAVGYHLYQSGQAGASA